MTNVTARAYKPLELGGICLRDLGETAMANKVGDKVSISALEAKRDYHLAQYQRFEGLVRELKGIFAPEEPPAKPEKPAAAKRSPRRSKANGAASGNPIVQMALPEATATQLSLFPPKDAQLCKTIWTHLKKAGYTTTARDPAHAVLNALNRRAKTHGDVVLVGNGYWGMLNWYTAAELAEQKKSLGGMGGRDREEHVRRTKRGIRKLLARGGRYGAPVKITDEVIRNLQAHIAAGDSIVDACRKEKISAGSFHNLRRQKNVPGLVRLTGAARRKAIEKARLASDQPASDLLTPRTEGSIVH